MPQPDLPTQHLIRIAAIGAVFVGTVVLMLTSGSDEDVFEPYDGPSDAVAERVDVGVAIPTAGARRAGDAPTGERGSEARTGKDGPVVDRPQRTNEHGIGNDPGPDPSEVPPPPPRKTESDDGDPRPGQLGKADIRKGIEAVRPLVKACYEDALQEFPDASGRVTVGFRIVGEDGEGRVEMSELDREKTDLFDERLHDCMLKSVGEATFEVPAGGGVVNVTYPFQFSNGSDEEVEE